MSGLGAWLGARVPTRESLESHAWLRPFAHLIFRSELWRMNRRSVPRGVALGLFVGVMIPFAHFIVAIFVAVFVRANIPAAMAATFIGFPVIYVGIVAVAYRIGEWLLHLDAMTGIQPIGETMQQTGTDDLLKHLTGAGLDTAFGLLVIATVLSVLGYVLASVLWRWWVARKRRQRLGGA
ncbi:DUF2062 domain-containing protein [Novosphingobium flavum]|uniref:DUF2062 domain-containing protein n=1 Tax=Novosphingobium flavum TaxID=1778672 RepID=A0A7X1FT47_9SPHN|nr:DUF2062 domain-containing protein [Novosphingobium flavum]MBC2666499.1 DUF2062 domain-containing protein [Novosphingobium flavum]